jgi:hypothetical protein
MPVCRNCETAFPVKQEIDGKLRNLQNRKYCLECSPFGSGNTKKLEQPTTTKKRSEKYARWQKKARKERKQKLVELAGGKCVICGYDRCYKALEFHHKDGDEKSDKSFGISQNGMLARWDKLVEEVEKCVLLCANCHREVHEGLHEDFRR